MENLENLEEESYFPDDVDEERSKFYVLARRLKSSTDIKEKNKISDELYHMLGMDIRDYEDGVIKRYKNTKDERKKRRLKWEIENLGVDIDKIDRMESVVKDAVKDAIKEMAKEGSISDKDEDNSNVNNDKKLLTYLSDLSKDNFIIRYVDIMKQMTSSYPEYHFSMAVSILSIISDRKLKLSMRHKEIYPNIWFFLLGLSTVSQKTTAFDLAEETLSKLSIEAKSTWLIKNRLPGYFSPEGFGKSLENCKGHGYEWKDESGELLKTMEKEYMSNMRDFLCDMYGNKSFHKSLSKTEIFIEMPFVNMVLATTPDSFKEYTKIGDLTSGWLYRYIYIYPEYDKNWMPIGKRTDKNNDKIRDLVLLLKKKVDTISKIKIGNEINFGFESGCLELYEKWSEKMYYKAQKDKNQIEAAFIGRLEDYVLKLAIIFMIGEPGFKIEISNKIMEITCQLVENYFLPTALKIAEMVEKDTKNNQIEKVLDIIKSSGGIINRSNLLKKSRLKARELDDVCTTLMESEEIWIGEIQRRKIYKLITD